MRIDIEIPDAIIHKDAHRLLVDTYTAAIVKQAKEKFAEPSAEDPTETVGWKMVREALEVKLSSERTREAVANTAQLFLTQRLSGLTEPIVAKQLTELITTQLAEKIEQIDLPTYIEERARKMLDLIPTESLAAVQELIATPG
jgi:uncharacterized membrane protein YheB (UPF0754 family)